MLSLKLKFENLERTSSDVRIASTSTTEKLADTQKELSRLRSKIADDASLIGELRAENSSTKELCNAIANEKDEILVKLDEANSTIYDLQEKSSLAIKELESKHNAILTDLTAKMTSLEADNRYMSEKALDDENLTKTLDEYKKRAQNALKKVHLFVSLIMLYCDMRLHINSIMYRRIRPMLLKRPKWKNASKN